MIYNLRIIANYSKILLSFGGLFYLLDFPVQSLSPFILIGVIIYIIIPKKYRKDDVISNYLSILLIYIVIITFKNILIELFSYEKNVNNRFGYLIRQSISISVGIIQYTVFKYILSKENKKQEIRITKIVIILNFILSIIDIIFFNRIRSQGLFSEPSHLAEFFAFFCLPSLYIYEKNTKNLVAYSLISFITIFLTYSTTGILRVFLFYVGILIFTKNQRLKRIIYIFMIISLIIIFIYIKTYNNNYMSKMIILTINSIKNGSELSRSITDRIAFFDIIKNAISTRNIFGLGLGAEAYENLIVSEKMLSIIKTEKHWGMSIVSMPGKILVYGGLLSFLVFIKIYLRVFKICINISNNIFVCAVLFAMFLYMFIGLSSFALPYLWYWFAYVSNSSIIKEKKYVKTN